MKMNFFCDGSTSKTLHDIYSKAACPTCPITLRLSGYFWWQLFKSGRLGHLNLSSQCRSVCFSSGFSVSYTLRWTREGFIVDWKLSVYLLQGTEVAGTNNCECCNFQDEVQIRWSGNNWSSALEDNSDSAITKPKRHNCCGDHNLSNIFKYINVDTCTGPYLFSENHNGRHSYTYSITE